MTRTLASVIERVRNTGQVDPGQLLERAAATGSGRRPPVGIQALWLPERHQFDFVAFALAVVLADDIHKQVLQVVVLHHCPPDALAQLLGRAGCCGGCISTSISCCCCWFAAASTCCCPIGKGG